MRQKLSNIPNVSFLNLNFYLLWQNAILKI